MVISLFKFFDTGYAIKFYQVTCEFWTVLENKTEGGVQNIVARSSNFKNCIHVCRRLTLVACIYLITCVEFKFVIFSHILLNQITGFSNPFPSSQANIWFTPLLPVV